MKCMLWPDVENEMANDSEENQTRKENNGKCVTEGVPKGFKKVKEENIKLKKPCGEKITVK